MITILDHANILADFTNVSHEEWQEQRQKQKGIGGSDASTIIGLNSFKDPYTLYLEKLGEIPPSQAGEAAEWGNTLEPVVAQKWLERHGERMTIEPFNYLLQSVTHEFMLANIDRLIRRGDDFGILEVKTASEYLNNEWENGEILANGKGTGKVPQKYYAQIQHYFKVTGLQWGYFASLVGGNKLYSVYVERNDDYIDWLVEQELIFWNRLELRVPPDVDGSESCKQLLSTLYPAHDEEVIELMEESFGELIFRRDALKEQLNALEKELTEVENRIKETIGEHKGAKWNGWTVTWGYRNGRTNIDANLLEEKYPEIYKEVLKQGAGYRQLSVSKPKTKKGA